MATQALALHMPDGFLSIPVALLGWLLTILVVGYALRQTGERLGERQIPLLGVIAAFIFAAQAINFPVAAGATGHLLGGALAAILLGPWAASLIMTAVIATQALLFQDGGLVVMGWNIINMGVITSFSGYASYRLLLRILGARPGANISGAFFAAWLSVVIGAMATSVELAVSGIIPLKFVLPAMVSIHGLIGIGEAIITVGAVSLLRVVRPEVLVGGDLAPRKRASYFVVVGLLLAIFVAAISPFAATDPDGLEKVASSEGFLQLGDSPVYELFPDYVIPYIESEALATFLAVAGGAILVFILSLFIGMRIAKPQRVHK